LLAADIGGFGDLAGPVAADPGVRAHLLANFAAEHLPGGKPERAALEVPQRLFEARQRRHDDRSAAIESAAIANLPDFLDGERIGADEAVAEDFEHAVNRFGPALEARLPPAERAVIGLDTHEQPPRRHVECFDL